MLAETLLCLTATIFHEARGESLQGQKAVANVVINRSLQSGKSICHEVKRKHQFSWYKPHKEDKLFNIGYDNFEKYSKIAIEVLFENDNTYGSQFFHNPSVKPYWIDKMKKTITYGNHIFYRLPKQKQYTINDKLENIVFKIIPNLNEKEN